MQTTQVPLHDLVRLGDLEFLAGDPFPVYQRLRREAPLYFCQDINTWAVTKHADIRYISKTNELFTTTRGVFLSDADAATKGAPSVTNSYFPGELVMTSDPPRHNELRHVLSPSFTPRVIGMLEPAVRSTCDDLLGAIVPGEPFDWIEQVATVLPLVVIARLLGVPYDNIPQLARWSDELDKLGMPATPEAREESTRNFKALVGYMYEQIERKRADLGEDLLSVLVQATIDGARLTPEVILTWASVVLAGGNGTTRAFLGNMVNAFALHPDQRELLVSDPSRRAVNAVEESLRWAGPVTNHARCATTDTELRGEQIRAGQWLCLLYEAGNRDEEVYDDSESFDITRDIDPPMLSFGWANHVCIGAAIARLQARMLLAGLAERFSGWDVVAEPTRIRSTFRRGFVSLPVVFYR